jgi:hypothetical protein
MVARLRGRDLGLRRHVGNHRQARRENGETSEQTGKEAQTLHIANFGRRRRSRKSRFGSRLRGWRAWFILSFEYSGNTV